MRPTSTALLTCSTCGQRLVSANTSDRLAEGPRYTSSWARRLGTCTQHKTHLAVRICHGLVVYPELAGKCHVRHVK